MDLSLYCRQLLPNTLHAVTIIGLDSGHKDFSRDRRHISLTCVQDIAVKPSFNAMPDEGQHHLSY